MTTTDKPINLASLVWPEEQFARSTNIAVDRSSMDGIADYRFTLKSVELLENLTESFSGISRDRAWSIIGPYGSGKSTFGLFLAELMSGDKSDWLARCTRHLEIEYLSLHSRISDIGGRYLPVVAQGSGSTLDLALCRALQVAMDTSEDAPSWITKKFMDSLARQIGVLESGISDSAAVLELLDQARSLATLGGYSGLLVIVDEFGKFLERSSASGSVPDLMTAQYLAEMASSSKEPDLIFLTILHQGMQHYASSLSRREWTEWAKIQGRFRQVDFTENPDNQYGLIASALKKGEKEYLGAIASWSEAEWAVAKKLPLFQKNQDDKFWPNFLKEIYPFSPLAMYALPRLSSRLAQNERSLFTFLASDDPLGFKAFLQKTAVGKRKLPSLQLDYLYDYFVSGSRYGMLPPDVQRSVSEIDAALDRLGDRPSIEIRIIKAMGLIGILRLGPEMPSSEEVLASAVGAHSRTQKKEIRSALDSLLARRIVVFRQFADEYRIWQGSDFDFDAATERAREEIAGDFDLPAFLQEELIPRPLLARRHSFQTATNRLFEVKFLGGTEQNHAESQLASPSADGLIVRWVPSSEKEAGDAVNEAKSSRNSRIIYSISKDPVALKELALDLASLRIIRTMYTELEDDIVALKELVARIEFSEDLLLERLSAAVEPGEDGPSWFWRGLEIPIRDRKALHVLLSDVCDEVFNKAPMIRNELLNRGRLSSAVVIAVKKIIAGLLEANGEPGLGFNGNGPEVSILRSALEEHGLYAKGEDGRHQLTAPTGKTHQGVLATWVAIDEFLQHSTQNSVNLSDIYSILGREPYGVRVGPIPLLIWTVMIFHRDTLCMYENGTYVKDWSAEIFDRFVKDPNAFTVRWLVYGESLGDLLHQLNASIPEATSLVEKRAGVALTGFLQNLFKWYYALPDYAKRTLKISNEALEFRRVLTSVVDPTDLIFSRIPEALRLKEGNAPEQSLNISDFQISSAYADGFASAVQEITGAYGALAIGIIDDLARLFGCVPTVHDVREFFQNIPDEHLGYVRDITAKAFLLRARDPSTNEVQWLESIGASLANQAPQFWMDHHYEEFSDKLSLVALALGDARKVSYATKAFTGDGKIGHRRMSVEIDGVPSVDLVVSPDEVDANADIMAKELVHVIESKSTNNGLRSRQLALMKALEMISTEVNTGND